MADAEERLFWSSNCLRSGLNQGQLVMAPAAGQQNGARHTPDLREPQQVAIEARRSFQVADIQADVPQLCSAHQE